MIEKKLGFAFDIFETRNPIETRSISKETLSCKIERFVMICRKVMKFIRFLFFFFLIEIQHYRWDSRGTLLQVRFQWFRFNLRIVIPLLKVGELLIYAHSCFWIDKFEREHGWLEIREGWNRRIITVLNAWWNAFKLVEFIGKLFISILYMYVYLF